MKVFVIWDPLLEEVKSVHSTEKLCVSEVIRLDEGIDPRSGTSRNQDRCYTFEYDEFEVDG